MVVFELSKDDFTYFNPTRKRLDSGGRTSFDLHWRIERDIRLEAEGCAVALLNFQAHVDVIPMDDFMANPGDGR